EYALHAVHVAIQCQPDLSRVIETSAAVLIAFTETDVQQSPFTFQEIRIGVPRAQERQRQRRQRPRRLDQLARVHAASRAPGTMTVIQVESQPQGRKKQ